MRYVAAALQHRNAARTLLGLGIIIWTVGTPLVDFGEDDEAVRPFGVMLIVLMALRLTYLALLDQDQKYAEGHRRGFHLGRRTGKPVVVPLTRPNAERSQPSRGHTDAHGRPAEHAQIPKRR
jgi:hypothetical protein